MSTYAEGQLWLRISEVPFAQGVIIGAVLQFVSQAGGDLLDGFYDIGAVSEHFLSVDMRDVVEIDVHGEPRQAEIEQVESGATFENEFSAKEGVFVELGEEFAKPEDFFETVGLKPRGLCSGGKA